MNLRERTRSRNCFSDGSSNERQINLSPTGSSCPGCYRCRSSKQWLRRLATCVVQRGQNPAAGHRHRERCRSLDTGEAGGSDWCGQVVRSTASRVVGKGDLAPSYDAQTHHGKKQQQASARFRNCRHTIRTGEFVFVPEYEVQPVHGSIGIEIPFAPTKHDRQRQSHSYTNPRPMIGSCSNGSLTRARNAAALSGDGTLTMSRSAWPATPGSQSDYWPFLTN
jgi:hypothetical protein